PEEHALPKAENAGVAPAQHQSDGHKGISEILADEIEPEDVECQWQHYQDERRNEREANQLKRTRVRTNSRHDSPSDLEDEQSLRAEHEQSDDHEKREDLGHRACQEEFERRLRLRDRERGGDRAQKALRSAEDHDQERVDDVELSGSRPGG